VDDLLRFCFLEPGRAGRGIGPLLRSPFSDEDRPPWSENDDVDLPRRFARGLQALKGELRRDLPFSLSSFALGIHLPLRLPHIPRPPLYIRSISLTSLP